MMTQRFCYPARAILLGLLITQILATIHVYRSNLDLHRTVSVLQDAGYTVIPNTLVAPTLKQIGPAFWGGLFFTLSLGAGLSLFSFLAAWIWDRLFYRNKNILYLVFLFWLALVLGVNAKRISPMVTMYFLVVPSVVFVTTLKILPQKKEKPWRRRLVSLLPIVLLSLLWALQADRFLFLNIRDFLLLSNPVGKKIDAFYYRYTLYPAEVFKTLEQKTLKTCRVTGDMGPKEKKRMEDALVLYDYLPITAAAFHAPIHLEIESSRSKLVFRHEKTAILDITVDAFFKRPDEALRNFSEGVDGHVLFRRATMLCLVTGFPILLYILVFSICHFAVGFFVETKLSLPAAALMSFLLGLALLAPLVVARPEKLEGDRLSAALESENWKQRVCALRTMVEQNNDPIEDYSRFITSPHVPERYWTAKALGLTRSSKAYETLLVVLEDNHPNVVSMAFLSLGQQKDQRAVPEILLRLQTSYHWYNQWYAYRALRSLGWKQKIQP
jgi:Ca2+/Na+ antiporter